MKKEKYFNLVLPGFQLWTVPVTATYKFLVNGAGNPQAGSFGACVESQFDLRAGDKILIVIGQTGKCQTAGSGGLFKNLYTDIEIISEFNLSCIRTAVLDFFSFLSLALGSEK